jgi:hypothetical protein
MSEYVEVPFEDKVGEQATLLLAAAEDLDLGQSVVQTRSGAFYVPEEVAQKASGGESADDKPQKKAAKKSNTKKSTSNKSQE